MHQQVEKKLIQRSKRERKNKEKILFLQFAILNTTLIWIEINRSTLKLRTSLLKTPTKKTQVETDPSVSVEETHWPTSMSCLRKLLPTRQQIFSNSRLKIRCHLTLQKLRRNQMRSEKLSSIFLIRIQKINWTNSVVQWKSHPLRRTHNNHLNNEATFQWKIEETNPHYESNWSLNSQKIQRSTCHCSKMKIHMNYQSNQDLDLRIKTNFHFETRRNTLGNLTRITLM